MPGAEQNGAGILAAGSPRGHGAGAAAPHMPDIPRAGDGGGAGERDGLPGVVLDPAVPGAVTPATPACLPSATAAEAEILVDPAVSRAKFDREVDRYRDVAVDCRRRGWWLLDATFPNVLVSFVAPQLRPRPVVFSVRINFENYDLWAPSVRLVDPFTGTLLRAREIPQALHFYRSIPTPDRLVEVPGVGLVQGVAEQPLLQFHGPEDVPFFCLPGVREYHDHPAHTGDDWLLHRDRGFGTLYFLLEKLARYGLEPVQHYQVAVQIAGYVRGQAPV
jgi:hypothetical protein